MDNLLIFVEEYSAASLLDAVRTQMARFECPLKLLLQGEGEVHSELLNTLASEGDIELVDESANPDLDLLCFDKAAQLEAVLHCYINEKNRTIIAPVTASYYKKRPLYLIGIPKSGTHLLMELAKIFGYVARGVSPEKPKGGEWYYVEHSNAHTVPKRFFIDSVYSGDFGLRDHPFIYSPALFIYRNPADVVVSEANYYHQKGNSAFYNYLAGKSFEQRLSLLINDPYLLGTIRERIIQYLPWLSFSNVIPLSFEELVGSNRGGDDKLLYQLVWSLQLKLHVPGSPVEFAKQLLASSSDTHYKGLCGVYKEHFSTENFAAFNALGADFVKSFGYKVGAQASTFSVNIARQREQKLIVDSPPEWPPIIRSNQFLDHRVIEYEGELYGVPFGTCLADVKRLLQESDSPIVTGRYVEEVKVKLIKKYIG